MMARWRVLLVYLLLLGAAVFVQTHGSVMVPPHQPLAEFPTRQGEWAMAHQSQFSEQVLAVLKPTDYLSRSYALPDGRQVGFYLGFHGGGPESGPIHSPKHCLPGGGRSVLTEQKKVLQLDGDQLALVEAVYQAGEQQELFLYWYQVRGESLNDEYALKFSEVWNSLLHGRRDAAFIRLAIPVTAGVEAAVATGEEFIAAFYPLIKGTLPQ